MKKIITYFLVFSLILCLCSCSNTETELQNEYAHGYSDGYDEGLFTATATSSHYFAIINAEIEEQTGITVDDALDIIANKANGYHVSQTDFNAAVNAISIYHLLSEDVMKNLDEYLLE